MDLKDVLGEQTTVLCDRKKPYKVAVVSGKGGVGKSNIVLNVGLALGRFGLRTLLIDGNINLSNLDILSGVSPRNRLADVVEGTIALKDAVERIAENVFMLAGSSDGKLKKLTSSDIAILINEAGFLEPVFQYILIDTAGGIVQESISLALLSDEVFVVCTPEPTAMTDAYVLAKTLKRIDSSAELRLLVNKAGDGDLSMKAGEKLVSESEKFLGLGMNCASFIPSDISVEQAVALQSPLIIGFPDSPSSESIIAIAREIEERRKLELSKGRNV